MAIVKPCWFSLRGAIAAHAHTKHGCKRDSVRKPRGLRTLHRWWSPGAGEFFDDRHGLNSRKPNTAAIAQRRLLAKRVSHRSGSRAPDRSRTKRRGLEVAPDLAVGDGALDFWKAIEEVFSGARHQRCWVHKTASVLNKVALSVQLNMRANLREIYGTSTRMAAIDVFADEYSAKHDKAVTCLTVSISQR
jgi:Transposase, Mutator family